MQSILTIVVIALAIALHIISARKKQGERQNPAPVGADAPGIEVVMASHPASLREKLPPAPKTKEPASAVIPEELPKDQGTRSFSTLSLKEKFLWAEILGTPKGLP